jgi:hypothetical protein
MSKWGDVALKNALSNPDAAVIDNTSTLTNPHEYDCGSQQNGNAYIRTAKAPTETTEQIALFAWIDANAHRHPALAWVFHPANGEYRHPATAGRLKAMGVRPGVPDVLLPCIAKDAVAGVEYVGLAIELKRSDHSNNPTVQQNEWLSWLDSQQWRCVVCYGAAEAINVICEYLEVKR